MPAGKHRIGIDPKDYGALVAVHGGRPENGLPSSPAHEVELDDFFIDVDEVTVAAFEAFMRDTGRLRPGPWAKAPRTGDAPATFVTYDDAEAFLEWCGKRLPTEFEWEAAARWRPPGDGTDRWWPWGKEFRAPESQPTGLHPIGSSPHDVSALGIRDLAGNALEMTSSIFDPYPASPLHIDVRFSGSLRVLRGGSSLSDPLHRMTTNRTPLTKKVSELVGFRGAMSKARGKDLFGSLAGGNPLSSQLETLGPPMKDEATGRPELALEDPARFSALMAGGWDAASGLPSRARFIGVTCRKTNAFTDVEVLAKLAKDSGGLVLLGLFLTDVDLGTVPVPAGKYWVLFAPDGAAGTRGPAILLKQLAPGERRVMVPGTRVRFHQGMKAPTSVAAVDSNALAVVMSFRTPGGGGFGIEMRLGVPAAGLAEFR